MGSALREKTPQDKVTRIMSLIPAFELGLWNAWIFMLYVIFSNVLPYVLSGWLIDKEVWKRGAATDMPLNETEKRISTIISFLFLALIAYSIFLPLKLGTVWFFAGFLIYLLGAIIETIAMLDFFTTAVDKPVTKRVYSFSRNPMYLGMFLIFGGTGIACVSWVFLLLTAVFIILLHIGVVSEERFCLQKYGNAYREYMNNIPRWIGIPKSRKNLHNP
jgi:protein-S-isoprenylcysteine O-methyltransferase Ste14